MWQAFVFNNTSIIMIRIALQSKGRLNEESIALLADAGIRIEESRRKLLSRSEDYPLEVLYLRDDDIPQAVATGVADLGIVGLNEVLEKGFDVSRAHDLGFGRCRISLAIPKNEEYKGAEFFAGRTIATSYPKILKEFFNKKGIDAKIEEIAGSVEIAPAVGMADAIFDIVSSGGTLVSNGLREVEVVVKSEAVLIATPGLPAEKQKLLDELIFRFEAIERSRGKKYILLNIPTDKIPQASAIIPGVKSPTILPLAQPGWSSMHAVVDQKELWGLIGQLKGIGAEDILVLALEKMIR